MVSNIAFGIKNLLEANKALKELQAMGVSPLTPEYREIEAQARRMANEGLPSQVIINAFNMMLRTDNQAAEVFRRAAGGNLAGTLNAALQYKRQGAIAELAKADAETRRQNMLTKYNVFKDIQQQKNFNEQIFNLKAEAISKGRGAGQQIIAGAEDKIIDTGLAGLKLGLNAKNAKLLTQATKGVKGNNPFQNMKLESTFGVPSQEQFDSELLSEGVVDGNEEIGLGLNSIWSNPYGE
jgi:hypothetical protein